MEFEILSCCLIWEGLCLQPSCSICRHLSPETPRKAAEFATALAAQIAANSKEAGFAVWLFELVIQNVSLAALADSELKLVNLQILWHLLDHAQIKL